jgi:hypothetical protein
VKMDTLRADWFKLRAAQAIRVIERLTPFMEERLAVMLASTVDVERSVKKLMNSIQSLGLYMLTDVHIEQLRKSQSAPDLLPLTIMQAKVYCDEELSVFLDVEEDRQLLVDDPLPVGLADPPSSPFTSTSLPTTGSTRTSSAWKSASCRRSEAGMDGALGCLPLQRRGDQVGGGVRRGGDGVRRLGRLGTGCRAERGEGVRV